MPNHFHLLVGPLDRDLIRYRMGAIRRELARNFPEIEWEGITEPKPLADRFHLLREIRYIHLNPCRKQLCVDPIEWEWSTHREYLGAVANPWVNLHEVVPTLGRPWTIWSEAEFLLRFHLYISGDPSVHPMGTWAPAIPQGSVSIDLKRVKTSAALVLRCHQDEPFRKGQLRARLVRVLSSGFELSRPKLAELFRIDRRSVSENGRKAWDIEDRRLFEALRTLQMDPRFFGPGSIRRLDRF